MSKAKQVLTIIIVIAFFIGVALFVLFNGVLSHDAHYVKIEINPKVEFITDGNNKVTSVMPLNEEALVLLVQENFIGLDVDLACKDFVRLCAEADYLDVDGEDNVINITIVSGFMQALEMKVYEAIDKYLLDNEILAALVENDNDIAMNKKAKEKNVSSSSKFSLIESIIYLDNTKTLDELNDFSENELIHALQKLHQNSGYSTDKYTAEELSTKAKLIDFNRVKYNNHISKITSETQSLFGTKFDEFKRQEIGKYEIDFDSTYSKWLEKHYYE